MLKSAFRWSLFCAAYVAAIVCTEPVAGGQPTADAVARLNGAFRKAYALARMETLAHCGPIIIARGDGLVLLHNGQRLEGTVVDRAYHDLKTVAHVPLAINLILNAAEQGVLDEGHEAQLREFQMLTELARKSIGQHFDDRRLAKRQTKLLTVCSKFMKGVLRTKRFTRDDLQGFLHRTQPQVQDNIERATRIRIDNYHRQALSWKETLSEDEWSRLHVVVQGAAMPRANNLAVQYFAKLLGERGEGRRIVYAESLFTESQALNRLGTHLLDSAIGKDYFSDPWRMHRDLLGDAAASYLDHLNFETP